MQDPTPPFHQAPIVEDVLPGVLHATREQVLRLGAGKEVHDELFGWSASGSDEEGDESGGDFANRGWCALGEFQEGEVSGRVGLGDEDGGGKGGGEDVYFQG